MSLSRPRSFSPLVGLSTILLVFFSRITSGAMAPLIFRQVGEEKDGVDGEDGEEEDGEEESEEAGGCERGKKSQQ